MQEEKFNKKTKNMKYYKCDGCSEAEAEDLHYWLTIGTSDEQNKLFIENNTKFQGLLEARTHHDMHFCSAKCFVNYLFGKDFINSMLPTYEEIEKHYSTKDGYVQMDELIEAAKWLRDFVLAATPINTKTNDH